MDLLLFLDLCDMNGKNSIKLDTIATAQHYVTYNVTLRWVQLTFDWQISHAYFCVFQRFVSHVRSAETNPKQNVLGLFCVCFGFVLELFCFSCKSCLRGSSQRRLRRFEAHQNGQWTLAEILRYLRPFHPLTPRRRLHEKTGLDNPSGHLNVDPNFEPSRTSTALARLAVIYWKPTASS